MSADNRDLQTQSEGPDEAELLRQARELLPRVDAEPRPGFAARVAARAADERNHSFGARWLRWAIPLGALAAAAAAILIVFGPHVHRPVAVAKNDDTELLLHSSENELAMAERLELYENLTLLQNEAALEDLDVVAALHQLKPETNP